MCVPASHARADTLPPESQVPNAPAAVMEDLPSNAPSLAVTTLSMARAQDKQCVSVHSLLCEEKLQSLPPANPPPLGHEHKDTMTKDTLNSDDAPGQQNAARRVSSSSVASASIMEYSMSTELSDEMGQIIFGPSGIHEERPQPPKLEENSEPKTQVSLGPLFPETTNEERGSCKFINLRPRFRFLRTVPSEDNGAYIKWNLGSSSSRTPLSMSFRTSNATPSQEKVTATDGPGKKRKARPDEETKSKASMSSLQPQEPQQATRHDATMLLAPTLTSKVPPTTMPSVSLRTNQSTKYSETTGAHGNDLPISMTQAQWWPNAQCYQHQYQAVVPLGETQALLPSKDSEALLTHDSLINNKWVDEEDLSWGLMGPNELKSGTSDYLCLRDKKNSDPSLSDKAFITNNKTSANPSHKLPLFPVHQPAPTLLASHFSDKNTGFKLQPQASPAINNGAAFYARRTQDCIDDDLAECKLLQEFNATDLDHDMSDFMGLNDINSVDVLPSLPNEISVPCFSLPTTSRELPWFPVQLASTLESQSSSVGHLPEHQDSHLPQLHSQPDCFASEPGLFGTKTKVSLLGDDETEEQKEIDYAIGDYPHSFPFDMAEPSWMMAHQHEQHSCGGSTCCRNIPELKRTRSHDPIHQGGEHNKRSPIPSPKDGGGALLRVQQSPSRSF